MCSRSLLRSASRSLLRDSVFLLRDLSGSTLLEASAEGLDAGGGGAGPRAGAGGRGSSGAGGGPGMSTWSAESLGGAMGEEQQCVVSPTVSQPLHPWTSGGCRLYWRVVHGRDARLDHAAYQSEPPTSTWRTLSLFCSTHHSLTRSTPARQLTQEALQHSSYFFLRSLQSAGTGWPAWKPEPSSSTQAKNASLACTTTDPRPCNCQAFCFQLWHDHIRTG